MKTEQKEEEGFVLEKPIRNLREVFKSIRSDIKKQKKIKRLRSKSSNSTLSERSVEYEEDDDDD